MLRELVGGQHRPRARTPLPSLQQQALADAGPGPGKHFLKLLKHEVTGAVMARAVAVLGGAGETAAAAVLALCQVQGASAVGAGVGA